MDIEQKRDYLKRYRIQQAKIGRLNEQSKINTDNKGRYKEEIKKAKNIRDSIEKVIFNVSDEVLSEILAQKYLRGKSLEETAEILNYSKRQVERLHLRALEDLKIC